MGGGTMHPIRVPLHDCSPIRVHPCRSVARLHFFSASSAGRLLCFSLGEDPPDALQILRRVHAHRVPRRLQDVQALPVFQYAQLLEPLDLLERRRRPAREGEEEPPAVGVETDVLEGGAATARRVPGVGDPGAREVKRVAAQVAHHLDDARVVGVRGGCERDRQGDRVQRRVGEKRVDRRVDRLPAKQRLVALDRKSGV